jgi:hypothetical protein
LALENGYENQQRFPVIVSQPAKRARRRRTFAIVS